MSTVIRCPKCGKQTQVPAYEGDGAYETCGCEEGKRLAKGLPARDGCAAYLGRKDGTE